jgi:replicative DNA helicase
MRDLASERAVLAGVYQYGGSAWLEVSDLLCADSFVLESNQHIWRCFHEVFLDNPSATIDLPTILTVAGRLGMSDRFEKQEEKTYLRSITNFPVKLDNLRAFARVIKKLEIAREAQQRLLEAANEVRRITGKESIDQILGITEQPYLSLAEKLTSANSEGPEPMSEGLGDYVEHLANNPRDMVGIRSGYRMFDVAIGGGFRPGTVNVIGARPKVGKSLLATNIAARVASGAGYDWPRFNPKCHIPVLQLDTEMTKQDQWHRLLALVSQVPTEVIETGVFAKKAATKKAIDEAVEKVNQIPYDFLSIAGQAFEETVSVIRRWLTKRVGLNEDGTAKPCLVIFDYLKLMSSEGMQSQNLTEFQLIGFMMTQLHNLAVRYGIPILTFVQLNREGVSVEDTTVIAQSDRTIWLCSNFSIYKAKSDEELVENPQFNRKLIPIIGRHGAGLQSGDYINLNSRGGTGTILEGPTRHQLQKGEYQPEKNQGFVIDEAQSDTPLFAD